MAGWLPMEQLIQDEEKQLLEEGKVPAAVKAAIEKANTLLKKQAPDAEVWACLENLPQREDFTFVEPSDLEGIRAARISNRPVFAKNFSDLQLQDKLHGAWLGRCAGCALGKPVELFMGEYNGNASWQRIKKYLTAVSPSEWPLKDYVPLHSPAENETGEECCPDSCRERISFMESDDDIRYTVLGQITLRQYGKEFRSAHAAAAWLNYLPYRYVCTAETQSYRNMVIRYPHSYFHVLPTPEAVAKCETETDWHWITHFMNPYREWIGAQIRIDSYGYAAPGDPELAAEFAWRDARISHVKNGIYGAMFCAAMIAAAFSTDDPMKIIEAGLAQIPKTSRLYYEMYKTIDICNKYHNNFDSFESVIIEHYKLFGRYHPVHTNNNAGLCVMALLLSGGDFHRAITLAVMGGLDSDCNGATVGSIVGAIAGARRIPTHWSGRLNDTLKSCVLEYHPIAISECAKRSVEIAKKILE